MSWDNLDWRPVDAATVDGASSLAELAPMIQSALDESVSALVLGPASVAELSIATATGAALPGEFAAAASFELLGTARRSIWVALDPAGGQRLNATAVTAATVAGALLEGFDGALAAMVGEGLSLGRADAFEPAADDELLLVRLALTDGAGETVGLVAAVHATVPVELNTHVVALQALGPDAGKPAPTAATAPSAATPAGAVPSAAPTPAPAVAPAQPLASAHPAPVASAAPAAPAANVRPLALDELTPGPAGNGGQNIDLLMGVSLQVTVEIGRTRLPIRDVLALAPGSIVELDKLAGEKVDVLVNGHPIASGEVVVVDENFGVRITDVVSRQRRVMSSARPG